MARNVSDSSARTPLPEGTVPVAIGLFIAGVCSFAFFRVVRVALGSDEAVKPGFYFLNCSGSAGLRKD